MLALTLVPTPGATQRDASENGHESGPPDGSRWEWHLGHLMIVALAGSFYLLVSYLPLKGADLWGHVIYGEWIVEHRSLPVEDPVMPLAQGMAVIDTAWLSQVLLAGVESAGGAEWLSRVFALTVCLGVLLLGRTFFLASGSLALSVFGTAVAVALMWNRLMTFRPESFGILAFAILLWLLTNRDGEASPRAGHLRLWLGIPTLFVVWANLDGSFIFGLAVLLCWCAGHAIDVAQDARSLRAAVDDASVRRRIYILELAVLAALLNPYGIGLLLHQLGFAASANLLQLPERQPMVMRGLPALGFALSWLSLVFVFRISRLRLQAGHVLLLAVFAFAAGTAVGRVIWYGPVFAWVLMPHLADIMSRSLSRRRASAMTAETRLANPMMARIISGFRDFAGSSTRYTMLCATLASIVFIQSPLGSQVLGRDPRPLGQLFGEAPLELAGFLAANPPGGQVFNPAPWGDWLALQGPDDLQVFATTNVHLLPARAWVSYQRIASAASGWLRILDGYRIETVILSKQGQGSLARAMRTAENWRLTYEDNQALVFTRAPVAAPEASG